MRPSLDLTAILLPQNPECLEKVLDLWVWPSHPLCLWRSSLACHNVSVCVWATVSDAEVAMVTTASLCVPGASYLQESLFVLKPLNIVLQLSTW